jgi:hypothetical protein
MCGAYHEGEIQREFVGCNGDEEAVGTVDEEFEEPTVSSYVTKMKRIHELQKLVEEEIGQFEARKEMKTNLNEIKEEANPVVSTVLSSVKGVEFPVIISISQKDDNEESNNNPANNFRENTLECESVNEEIKPTNEGIPEQEIEEDYEFGKTEQNILEDQSEIIQSGETDVEDRTQEKEELEDNEPEDSIMHVSMTMGDQTPLLVRQESICSSHSKTSSNTANENIKTSSKGKEDNKTNNKVNDNIDNSRVNGDDVDSPVKHRIQQEASSKKMREQELLASFLQMKTTEPTTTQETKKTKSKRTTILTTNINENVKKQTYKIRFRVNVGTQGTVKDPKSSVLQYLFGCFGGEKLFGARD